MRTGNVFTMKPVNDETTSALFSQLAGILGVGKRSDGRYHLADIATAGSINPWAKKKGFGYNSENFDYDPQNPDASNARRAAARKEKNQAFDLTNAKISSNGSVSDIASKYDGNMNGWLYVKPKGRAYKEPFRLRDFDGYDHGALCFVQKFTPPSRWAKDYGSFNVNFMISMPPEGSDDTSYLHHSDFPAVADAYIGVALIDKNGIIMRMTADDTVSNAGMSIDVPVNSLAEGTYTLYPFFSTKKLTFLDGDIIVSEQFTVPNTNKATLVLMNKSITMTIDAEYLFSAGTMHTLDYSVTIFNNSGGARTLENNWVRLRYADKSWNDIMHVDEKETPIGTITIAAGASYTYHGFFTNVVQDLYNSSRLWVSLNAGAYQEKYVPRQPMNPDLPDLEL